MLPSLDTGSPNNLHSLFTFIKRCRDCPVTGGEIQYHLDQYGSPAEGYKFYKQSVAFIRGSRSTWFSRLQMQYFFSSFHQAWVRYISTNPETKQEYQILFIYSLEANAEIFNEAFYDIAQRIRKLNLKLSPDEELIKHRHYLDRRSLSRAMRLYLLGKE